MIESAPNQDQMSFLAPHLIDQLNPKNPLLPLARKIPWDSFEAESAPLYSPNGRPAKRIA